MTSRVVYVHWNEAELCDRIAPLIEAGYEVSGHATQGEKRPCVARGQGYQRRG